VKLGDLRYLSGANPALVGMSVREVIDLTDQVISTANPHAGGPHGRPSSPTWDYADLRPGARRVQPDFDNGDTNNLQLRLLP
jgi:hypothetical protein